MSTIAIKDWYQLDLKLKSPHEDLKKLDTLMEALTREKLVLKWFFLFEPGPVIRVRIESLNKDELQGRLNELSNSNGLEFADSLPFSEYAENSKDLFNEETISRFANIMSEITQLTIKKLRDENQFDTYRIMERISHCLFNNMASISLKPEEHFLTQRLKERTRQAFDGDFENKIVEKKKE